MKTMERVRELMEERDLTLFKLSQICDVPYSTLKNTEKRDGQLSIDSIERICEKLEIPVYEFFMTDEDWEQIEAYAVRKAKRHNST